MGSALLQFRSDQAVQTLQIVAYNKLPGHSRKGNNKNNLLSWQILQVGSLVPYMCADCAVVTIKDH